MTSWAGINIKNQLYSNITIEFVIENNLLYDYQRKKL